MAEKLTYRDRMSPLQAEQSHLFSGDGEGFLDNMYASICEACRPESPHDDLKLKLTPMHPIEEMASAPMNLRFLQTLNQD